MLQFVELQATVDREHLFWFPFLRGRSVVDNDKVFPMQLEKTVTSSVLCRIVRLSAWLRKTEANIAWNLEQEAPSRCDEFR